MKIIIQKTQNELYEYLYPATTNIELLKRKNPDWIFTDFDFMEDVKYYDYDGSFTLKQDWETLKAEDQAAAQAEKEQRKFDTLQDQKLQNLKEAFTQAKIRPRVDTTLGYDVDGGYEDLTNYENAKILELDTIKDADNNMQSVTAEELDIIIQKIREHGAAQYQRKWTIEAELNNASTIEELNQVEEF